MNDTKSICVRQRHSLPVGRYGRFALFYICHRTVQLADFFRNIALRLQWVDIPSARKLHSGTPPLCGGASIFITLLLALLIHPISIPELHTVLACASILFVTGLADDKYNIEVKLRLLIQCVVAYVMVNYGDCRITELGSLTGSEKVVLSHSQSTIISVLAILAGSMHSI